MACRRIQRMLCDNFCKLLQRQTYTFLSSRNGMLLCFCALLLGIFSLLQFGEVALEWSVARYHQTVFSYEDNILHKSYQDRLCLPLPIDVVYTWVNGTDPRLLKDLEKLKNEIEGSLNESSTEFIDEKIKPTKFTIEKPNPVSKNGNVATTLKPKEGCPYQNCVPLNSLVLKLHSKTQKADLKAVDPVFKDATSVSNFTLEASRAGAKKSSVTLVKFSEESSLKHAVNRAFTIKGERVVAQRAYLTSQVIELAVRMRAVAMVSIKQPNVDGKSFKQFLYLRFLEEIKELEYYEKEKVAVLTFKDDEGYVHAMGLHKGELTFQNVPLVFVPVLLVWEPFPGNSNIKDKDNHFLASRFADNQELRYSLRSVEKYAPWVRKIFIVTNGQIPSWLNLDNPRVKVITHSEIFTNASHLPTFSSPAIESHLHQIPGLSKKFIYLNDDVMFGTEIWPDDFFTHAKGQKVFLSWPVPNCNDGCPSTWINDKYCDKACNVSNCDWDGGDCIGSKSKAHKFQSVISHLKRTKLHDFCNSGCADSWIGDRYCDSACNNPTCGLDAGDCGVKSFFQLYSVMLHMDTKVIHLPSDLQAVFFNLSEVYGKGKIIEGEHDGASVLRSVTIAQKFKVMTVTFYPNHTLTTATLRLVGYQTLNDTNKVEIKFNLTIETKSKSKNEVVIKGDKGLGLVLPTTKDLLEHNAPTTLYPIHIYNTSNDLNFWNAKHENMPLPTWKEVDQTEYCIPTIPDDMSIPEEVLNQIAELEKELKSGDITDKGYKRKKAKLIRERLGIACNTDFHPTTMHSEMIYMKSITAKTGHVQQPTMDVNLEKQSLGHGYSRRHLNSFEQARTEWSFLPWENQGIFKELQEKQNLMEMYKTAKFHQRTLLDAFSGSLLHVNRIYNRAFGYKPRKVPSHMPHMVDIGVMSELQAKFPEEFDTTSSHKLRSPNDMQFALSYFYYIIDQTRVFNFSRVFEEIDADKSGTLSDRELRTLLAKFHKLPLDAKTIKNFTSILKNCSGAQLGEKARERPKAEQQYGGHGLPLVTESLLRGCAEIMKRLNDSKKAENKFKYEVVGEDDIAFKMIKNNVSHVLLQLDEIRKNRKKFICLNDNIEHGKGNSSLVKNLLVDFYESLFPLPSQFELPHNMRNRFLYVDELKAWKKERRRFNEFLSVGMLVGVAIVVLVCIFRHHLFYLIRRVVMALSRILQTPKLSTSSAIKLLTV